MALALSLLRLTFDISRFITIQSHQAIIGFCSLALEDGDLRHPVDGYIEGSLQGARNLLSILSQIIEARTRGHADLPSISKMCD